MLSTYFNINNTNTLYMTEVINDFISYSKHSSNFRELIYGYELVLFTTFLLALSLSVLDNVRLSKNNQLLNGDISQSFQHLQKRMCAFQTRMKTILGRNISEFKTEEKKHKDLQAQYNNNMQTIISMVNKPQELNAFLESIGYSKNQQESSDEDTNDDVSLSSDPDTPYDDNNNYIRKRPRRAAAPVSFREFFSDSDTDGEYLPPRKKKL